MSRFQGLQVHRQIVSMPNIAVLTNSAGDAPEFEFPSVKSTELPAVSTYLPYAESSIATLMPALATAEVNRIGTPLPVSAFFPLQLRKVVADVRQLSRPAHNMDAGMNLTVTAVRPRRPRRSF